jgi:hypothetical protein
MKMVAASGAEIPSLGFCTHGMSHEHMLRTIPAALSANSMLRSPRNKISTPSIHICLGMAG